MIINWSFHSKEEINVLWKLLDKIKDISLPARLLYLFLSYFRVWLDRSKENVESDGAGIQCRFLRNKGDIFSVS